MRRLSIVFSAFLAVILYSRIANATPSFCSITGTVYSSTTGKVAPSVLVQFWYGPNTQNISGGIITNSANPLQVYTDWHGLLPTGTGAAALAAGSDAYIQVGNDTPQLVYIPSSCGGSSIDLNALMGNPDPPLSPVVTSIALNNTSSLSLSVTNPTGIGPATLTISGLVNSAGNGTITFDNSGNIVANGNVTAKGGSLVTGVSGSQGGCVIFEGSTSGAVTLCSPASNGATLILPQGTGASGNLLQSDGAGNLSWTPSLAVGRGGADKLVVVPNTGSPTAKLDATANGVYMVTPATLVTTYVTSFSATDIVVGAQSGSTAGGRDQTAAFGNSVFYHLYAIGGNGQTPALLSSLTGPPTGPTLPTNYTAWAYLGTFMTDGSGNVLAMREYGNLVHYNANQSLVSGGTATSATAITTSGVVPTIADGIQVSVHSTTIGAAGTASVEDFTEISVNGGTSVYFSTYFANVANLGGTGMSWAIVPNTSLTYLNTPGANGGTITTNINCHGYLVPNNSN